MRLSAAHKVPNLTASQSKKLTVTPTFYLQPSERVSSVRRCLPFPYLLIFQRFVPLFRPVDTETDGTLSPSEGGASKENAPLPIRYGREFVNAVETYRYGVSTNSPDTSGSSGSSGSSAEKP
jgi:hypothetical protein